MIVITVGYARKKRTRKSAGATNNQGIQGLVDIKLLLSELFADIGVFGSTFYHFQYPVQGHATDIIQYPRPE